MPQRGKTHTKKKKPDQSPHKTYARGIIANAIQTKGGKTGSLGDRSSAKTAASSALSWGDIDLVRQVQLTCNYIQSKNTLSAMQKEGGLSNSGSRSQESKRHLGENHRGDGRIALFDPSRS